MDSYRSTGVLDESAYREITRFAISRKRIWLVRIYAVVLAILAVLMLIAQKYHYAALFLAFTVLFALAPALFRRRYLRGAMKVLREAYPEGFARMESFFTVEGLKLHNLSSGAQMVLPYPVLRRAGETEHYFFLSTEARQFALVFKDCLTPEQQRSLLLFLKEQCPKLKIIH